METKKCSKCKEEKSVEFFGKDKKRKDGLRLHCNDCRKIESKIYNKKNKEKRRETIKKYYEANRESILKKQIEYTINNHDKIKKTKLKSYHKNKEKNKEKVKIYRKNNLYKRNLYEKRKKEEDILYRLKGLVRGRILNFLRKQNITKKNKTFDIVGCTPEFLKEHLEKQFVNGMNWKNYGVYGWHIDHIIPLSSAQTEEEIFKLCHYTNLQPLWAKDNLSKGDKIL